MRLGKPSVPRPQSSSLVRGRREKMERQLYQLVSKEDPFRPSGPERLRETRIDLLAVEPQGRERANRDGALWALIPTLRSGESLTLRYVLRPDTDAYIALGFHHDASRGAGESFMARRKALVRAASVALPEFAPVNARNWKPARTVAIAPRRLSVRGAVSAGQDRSPGPRKPLLADVFLPARPLAAMDVGAALTALAALNIPCALAFSVSPRRLDASTLRAVAAVEEEAERAFDAAPRHVQPRLLAIAHALRLWREGPQGVTVRAVFEVEHHSDSAYAGLVAQCLLGVASFEAPDAGSVDLADALPELVAHPLLIPSRSAMETVGLLQSAPPRPAESGLVIGSDPRNRDAAIELGDLSRHVYVIGATGTGKSSLLARMIAQDMAANRPVLLIDPHGDLFADVCQMMPARIANRAMIADVANITDPFTLNLLAVDGEPVSVQRNFIANQMIAVFKDVLYQGVPEAFGPMFEAYWRNALLLLMDAQGVKASLIDVDRVFGEPSFRSDLLERCQDEAVKRFWRTIALKAGGEASLENIAPYIVSKLTQFTGNAVLRPIIAAPQSSLDIPRALAEGRSVLCNLAKGIVGGPDSALIGGLITIRLFAAAMARAGLPREQRTPLRVYMDEFQTYATGVLGQMLAECRKFGVELVLANQSISQVEGRGADIGHAIVANVGSILSFRVGPGDANRLAEWFGPEISPTTLQRLPDRHLISRLMRNGVPCRPTQLTTEKTANLARF